MDIECHKIGIKYLLKFCDGGPTIRRCTYCIEIQLCLCFSTCRVSEIVEPRVEFVSNNSHEPQ